MKSIWMGGSSGRRLGLGLGLRLGFSVVAAVGLACGGDDLSSGSEGASSSSSSSASASTASASDATSASASESGEPSGSASAGSTSAGSTTEATTTEATTEATTSAGTSGTTGDPTSESGVSVSESESESESQGTTGDMSTGGVTSEGESDTEGDTEGDTTGGDEDLSGMWLVVFEDTSSPTRLYKLDLEDGHSTLLCELNTNNNYNTATFGRDGLLYTANANTKNLEIVDPCTCERTIVGPTMVQALPGITADQALGLYGLETSINQFVDINPNTGNATIIGALGVNWGTGGLTWSDELQDTYAINGSNNTLYRIDHQTGVASVIVQTNHNFGSVGIEWHPKTKEIYACSNPSDLLHVNPDTGEVTVIGPMNFANQSAHCDNLAAPWTKVQCVDDVE